MADNTNLSAKTTLRKHFLSKVQDPHILECFAGENRKLYNICYKDYPVTSLDMKLVKGVIKIDNRKFIASQDLTQFNYIDLDAYGSPYELLLNIFHKKQQDDPFIVIITDGLSRNLNYGQGSKLIQTIIQNKSKMSIPCLDRHHEYIIKLILKQFSEKWNIHISQSKIIREEKNKMFYLGIFCTPQNRKHIKNTKQDAINV